MHGTAARAVFIRQRAAWLRDRRGQDFETSYSYKNTLLGCGTHIVNGNIMLNWILETSCVEMWGGAVWLKTVNGGK
jgi:hypothetical protein